MQLETDERLEGYVVDIECLRKYRVNELAKRAREHSRECLLMGKCVESGYGLVSEDGALQLLDSEATPRILEVAQKSNNAKGIRMRAKRVIREGQPVTFHVEELNPAPGGMGHP